MSLRRSLLSLFALSFCVISAVASAIAAPEGRAVVIADLLPTLGKATVTGASAFQIQPASPSRGVLQAALFQHPKSAGTPAIAERTIAVPKVAAGERIVFAFDVALSDGIPWKTANPAPDGVRFEIKTENKSVYMQTVTESGWRPGAVDLTAFAGRSVRLSLLVHPRNRLNYDWALWGRPRLLRLAPGSATRETTATVGAFYAAFPAGVARRIRLIPDSGETPLEWADAADSSSVARAVCFDYSFPKARRVRIEMTPNLPGGGLVAAYEPNLLLENVTPARSLVVAGEASPLRVTVRNSGLGMFRAGTMTAQLRRNGKRLPAQPVPALAPGERWRGEWAFSPATSGVVTLSGSLAERGGRVTTTKSKIFVIAAAPRDGDTISNGLLRLRFVRGRTGYIGALVEARSSDSSSASWERVGAMTPLLQLGATKNQPARDLIPTTLTRKSPTQIVLTATQEGWKGVAEFSLEERKPLARLRCLYTPEAGAIPRSVEGPNLLVGEGGAGEASCGALFPGLEMLSGGEESSSARGFALNLGDRRAPENDKIAFPLMAVAVGKSGRAAPLNPSRFHCPDSLKDGRTAALSADGPMKTIALLWDMTGRNIPAAHFASPNRDDGTANHRMSLSLPAAKVRPGQSVTVAATLSVSDGPPLSAVRVFLKETGGLPAPTPWPHSEEDTLALCRDGLMNSTWNPQTKKWRGAVEFGDELLPGSATLLYWDALMTGNEESRRRANEGVETMLRERGPQILTDRASSHVLRWELPFLVGRLPEAMEALDAEIKRIASSQQPDGGWRFRSEEPQRASLGQRDDAVCGLASHHAWMLMRYARITGDPKIMAAGERALQWIETFRIPRGASVWECPIYEPDILAAAWNVAACVEGYKATQNPRYLNDAVYWAETALPFLYLRGRNDRPAMLGASLATFGTTFYTHTWLGVPVQWEGLVLGVHLRRLADLLDNMTPTANGSPLRPCIGLTATDWRRVADLTLSSGLHQQVTDGPRKGTYPDSISDFMTPNPVFISPENLWIQILERQGSAPDITTLRIRTSHGDLRISGVSPLRATLQGRRFKIELGASPRDFSYLLLTGAIPTVIEANGKILTPATILHQGNDVPSATLTVPVSAGSLSFDF